MSEVRTEILVIGGGTGGVAAALGAAALGRRVVLTEETDWLGGQLTAQAVPPDEHRWIESCGCTARYRAFRQGVRQYYKDHYPLNLRALRDPYLNPGDGSVSQLCYEPRVALAVLEAMLAAEVARGCIDIRRKWKPTAAQCEGDRIVAARFLDLDEGAEKWIDADYILDATELGDVLALAGVEYVSGAEAQAQTGEPHAPTVADFDNVQALTWCFAVGYDPESDRTIDKPDTYEYWRNYDPGLTPGWPGKMLSFTYTQPITREPITATFDPQNGDGSFWRYRRLIGRAHWAAGYEPHEVTLCNWPQNDYIEGNIIDESEEEIARHLQAARDQSLSLFYWLQTEAPRPDGGVGFAGLYLRPDITGTADGLAKRPYIRESRRICAKFTVTENHIGHEALGVDKANFFDDSVGVGCYRIDLHPSTGRDNYIDISSLPFQIPLGTLVPIRIENLLPASKNIGTTHISNGCYRLHPVEWNIGEAAGLLAAYCLDRDLAPQQVHGDRVRVEDFQALLRDQGVELEWPAMHPV